MSRSLGRFKGMPTKDVQDRRRGRGGISTPRGRQSSFAACLWGHGLVSCPASPKREWRNWQTRQLEVLVGVKSRGGSSPLSRMSAKRWPGMPALPLASLTPWPARMVKGQALTAGISRWPSQPRNHLKAMGNHSSAIGERDLTISSPIRSSAACV